jgi:hypothetical protein
MEMRRRMLPREDADRDAKESGYLRHRNILLLVCLLINSRTYILYRLYFFRLS